MLVALLIEVSSFTCYFLNHQGYFKKCNSVIVWKLFHRVLDLMVVDKRLRYVSYNEVSKMLSVMVFLCLLLCGRKYKAVVENIRLHVKVYLLE